MAPLIIDFTTEYWKIGGLGISEVVIVDGGMRFAAIGIERGGKALAAGNICSMACMRIFKINDAGKFTYAVSTITPTPLDKHSDEQTRESGDAGRGRVETV